MPRTQLQSITGGDPDAVNLLCSDFFDEPTRLSDHQNRAEGTTRRNWTFPVVPGRKLADKDLSILTGRWTFSAPESLAYDGRALKRATSGRVGCENCAAWPAGDHPAGSDRVRLTRSDPIRPIRRQAGLSRDIRFARCDATESLAHDICRPYLRRLTASAMIRSRVSSLIAICLISSPPRSETIQRRDDASNRSTTSW